MRLLESFSGETSEKQETLIAQVNKISNRSHFRFFSVRSSSESHPRFLCYSSLLSSLIELSELLLVHTASLCGSV